jgi:hypothetical protein
MPDFYLFILFLPDFHNRFPKNMKGFLNFVYFHLLSIAKFGLIFLWMIISLANQKIGGKKKTRRVK